MAIMKSCAMLSLLLLIGCSSSIPYDEIRKDNNGHDGPGYADKKLSEDSYKIRVLGYDDTDESVFMLFFHKRASELCGRNTYSVLEYNETIIVISHTVQDYASRGVTGIVKCI